MKQIENKKSRESGIELLKIIAMFLIIISHIVQSLENINLIKLGWSECFINLRNPTIDIQNFILIIIRHFGVIGNLIFIICSSYFLVGSKKDNKKKIMQLILDVLVISLVVLVIFNLCGIDITKKEVIKSLFPTILANNWYITCYILFLMVTPFLNIIIDNINKTQLLRINIVSIVLYWAINFIKESFFTSKLITFITIFFIVAYIKKYLMKFQNSKKINICMYVNYRNQFIYYFNSCNRSYMFKN